jgi:hypothetical protein
VTAGGTVVDLLFGLSADAPTTLAQWAFGGFAFRARKDGQVIPIGKTGVVRRAAPNHMDPKSNWPEAEWHGFHLKLRDGKEATVGVINRPRNGPTTWHVVPAIGLINPSITVPGPVQMTPGKRLVLRYRVFAFDGAPRLDVINALAAEWNQGGAAG